jgi:hypothetical protein
MRTEFTITLNPVSERTYPFRHASLRTKTNYTGCFRWADDKLGSSDDIRMDFYGVMSEWNRLN